MVFLTQYIKPIYFFIALFIGLFISYTTIPEPEVIYKFPTPQNADKVVYTDSQDNCYKYKSTEVECPSDIKKIFRIPIK